MKKLFYYVSIFATVSLIGCKKESYGLESNSISKNHEGVTITKKEGVLFFQNWEDVNKIEELLESNCNYHVDKFEKDNELILNRLRYIDMSKSGENQDDLIWLNELSVDSLENVLGWNEFQPLIDFENNFNFQSLRKKHYELLYPTSPNSINLLSDEQRLYYNTFPLSESLLTLFNQNAVIGVGDSIYKILGNNVWISSLPENRSALENVTEENYEILNGNNNYKIYQAKGTSCLSNKKKDNYIETSNKKYRIYGMLTVTNVGVANGRFIKGKTKCEKKNNNGNWKSRRTFCYVNGGAIIRPYTCENTITVSGTFLKFHHNRSVQTDRYRSDVLFRIRSGEFATIHVGGVGSNKLEFSQVLN